MPDSTRPPRTPAPLASAMTLALATAALAARASPPPETAPPAEPLARWAFLLFWLVVLGVGVLIVLLAMWRMRLARARTSPRRDSMGASRHTSVDPWFESGKRAKADDDSPNESSDHDRD